MQITIIGGGLTGLAAAYELSRDPSNRITILEKEDRIGGMLASHDVDGFRIEKYYHHIFSSDKETISLIQELELEKSLKWLPANNGYYINKTIYPLNTPLEFLKLPNFNLVDFIKLGILTAKIKLASDFETLDKISAEQWIMENSNKNVWLGFVSPLLDSKFGKNASDVSAAWFVKRIQIRSNRKYSGEILGYLVGGFEILIEALEKKIKASGVRIRCGTPVNDIISENKLAKGLTLSNGERVKADRIIFTASETSLQKLIKEDLGSPKIKYQGTLCVLLSLKNALTSGTYWLNIRDREIPFRALIEHTNFISEKNYNNEHLVYLTYYFQDTKDPLVRMKEPEIIELYFSKLKVMFPHFDRNSVNWWKIEKEFPTAPIYEKGYLNKILPYRTSVRNLFIAGINSQTNYPERSINGSIRAGLESAKKATGS